MALFWSTSPKVCVIMTGTGNKRKTQGRERKQRSQSTADHEFATFTCRAFYPQCLYITS